MLKRRNRLLRIVTVSTLAAFAAAFMGDLYLRQKQVEDDGLNDFEDLEEGSRFYESDKESDEEEFASWDEDDY